MTPSVTMAAPPMLNNTVPGRDRDGYILVGPWLGLCHVWLLNVFKLTWQYFISCDSACSGRISRLFIIISQLVWSLYTSRLVYRACTRGVAFIYARISHVLHIALSHPAVHSFIHHSFISFTAFRLYSIHKPPSPSDSGAIRTLYIAGMGVGVARDAMRHVSLIITID